MCIYQSYDLFQNMISPFNKYLLLPLVALDYLEILTGIGLLSHSIHIQGNTGRRQSKYIQKKTHKGINKCPDNLLRELQIKTY